MTADEFLGEPVCLDFVFFTAREIERHLDSQSFALLARSERDPYPAVQAQTRRAYLLAHCPA